MNETPPISLDKDNYYYYGYERDGKRNGLGYNVIKENKEVFIGDFDDDKKLSGLNIFKNEKDSKEIFYGFWSKANMKDMGIYVWNHKNQNEEIKEAFIGDFQCHVFHYGIYLKQTISKDTKKEYYYLGEISLDQTKTDDSAILLEIRDTKSFFFLGKVTENVKNNGKIKFSDTVDKHQVNYCILEENNNHIVEKVTKLDIEHIESEYKKFTFYYNTDFFDKITKFLELSLNDLYTNNEPKTELNQLDLDKLFKNIQMNGDEILNYVLPNLKGDKLK